MVNSKSVPNKKLLYFKNPILANGILKTWSEATGRPETTVAEEMIYEAVLPSNSQARRIAENYLFSQDGSIQESMKACFRTSGGGYGWRTRYPEVLPLLDYAYSHVEHSYVDQGSPAYRDLKYFFSSVAEFLANGPDSNFPFCASDKRRKAGDKCREMEERLKTFPETVNLKGIYDILLEYWDSLKYWAEVHHLIEAVVSLDKNWNETAKERLIFLDSLKEASQKWKEWEDEELPLCRKIMELQYDIMVHNYWGLLRMIGMGRTITIERLEDPMFDQRPFGTYSGGYYYEGLPEYLRSLLDGDGISIKTLCFTDVPDEENKKEELYHALRELDRGLEEANKRFRYEWFETNRFNALKEERSL